MGDPILDTPLLSLLGDGAWWTPSRAARVMRARGDHKINPGVVRMMLSYAHREGHLERRRTVSGNVAYRRSK